MALPNDPAADPEVERVARIFCEAAGRVPDDLDAVGDPAWRAHIDTAVSAIASWKLMTGR